MRTLILLLMMCASLFAAERGVSYNSATLVVTQTNLTQRFTASTVAQTLALGLNGTNGTFTINSTNGGYAGTITMDEGGSMLIVNSGPFDDFDASAFTFISTNIQLADLAQFWNPDVDPLNPAISLQASGTILAKGMYVEAAWESDDFTRIQPTDFKISGGTNTNYFFVEIGGTGEINRLHEGTNTFRVALDSGYGAGGIRALTDQNGTYLEIDAIGGVTASSTNTFTNKTYDAAATGNVLTFTKQLPLFRFPDSVDGTGCTYVNTNDFTAPTFMRPRFSASGATNANFATFSCLVPSDFSTAVDPTVTIKVALVAGDNDTSTYTIGMASVANGSSSSPTAANYVTITIPDDVGSSAGDVEGVNAVTLTGWGAAMTPGQWLFIRLQRDGSDASATAEDLLVLEITYTATQ